MSPSHFHCIFPDNWSKCRLCWIFLIINNNISIHGTLFRHCFPDGSDGKESACNAGDLGSIPGLGRFPWEGNSYPLQNSCLEKSMDRGDWRATVHVVQRTGHDSDFHFHFCRHQFTEVSRHSYSTGFITMSILPMRKLQMKCREVNDLPKVR